MEHRRDRVDDERKLCPRVEEATVVEQSVHVHDFDVRIVPTVYY